MGFQKFVNLKISNPNIKTLISVGGWNEDSYNFSNVAADAQKRKEFSYEVLEFIQQWGFDGFDIDWEYPALRNTTNPTKDKVRKLFH